MTKRKKYFVSCITPTEQIGVVQLEVLPKELKGKVEALAPCPCEFQSYELEEFEADLPVGEFINAAKMNELGY